MYHFSMTAGQHSRVVFFFFLLVFSNLIYDVLGHDDIFGPILSGIDSTSSNCRLYLSQICEAFNHYLFKYFFQPCPLPPLLNFRSTLNVLPAFQIVFI